MAEGYISGLSANNITKTDAENRIIAIYTNRVSKQGCIKVFNLVFSLDMPANNTWYDIFTLPSGFEPINNVEFNTNNGSITIDIRLSGSTVSVSNSSASAFTSKVFCVSFAYV